MPVPGSPAHSITDRVSPTPREYDSWPCDSFLLLPDSVLSMDASAFRDDLRSLDPVLSASLPDWSEHCRLVQSKRCGGQERRGFYKKSLTLLDHHEGLTVRPFGKGTVVIGGDTDNRGYSTVSQVASKVNNADGLSIGSQNAVKSQTPSQSNQKGSVQKDQQISSGVAACLTMFNLSDENALTSIYDDSFVGKNNPELNPIDKNYADLQYDVEGPNALFFGEERSASNNSKDRGERLRQLREKQQLEKQNKLQELKEQAAAAQKFREQQELLRRQRIDEMRLRDADRRNQVEERRRLILTADHDRKEASLRRNYDRDSRIELKRKHERSNVVFAFGSSTPRMLDPKESSCGYWGSRKAASGSNVNVPDASIAIRRPELAETADLSGKRATSARSLNRKPDGMQSGSTTPNSSSRPASALSQGSSGQQVTLRSKTTTRKTRPLSIAGSSLSSADKPRSNASFASRESRPTDRKSSVGSVTSAKLTRAKSAGGSDSNVASTSKAPAPRANSTPKRTPAQVKAESAARKAAEKSKTAQKRQTPQATPLASPAVPSKPLPSQADEPQEPIIEQVHAPNDTPIEPAIQPVSKDEPLVEPVETEKSEPVVENVSTTQETTLVSPPSVPDETKDEQEEVKVAEKSVTGYANEEEYKVALAENRRLAREAKEKEAEMEKQRQIEAEEKQKKEEDDYLRLMEEQKKAEEERLKIAIEEAERQRQLDVQRKEEEEIQRLEAEKIEKQKQAEAAERMRQEEIERLARKSRVAAIMSRTRGKGSSKGDNKSPDDLRTADNLSMMSDSFMANISSSMSDSMIVEAIESRQNEAESESTEVVANDASESVPQPESSHSAGDHQKPEVKANSEHLNGGSGLDDIKVDLTKSVNGDVSHEAVTNGKAHPTTDNQFDSFDPFSPVTPTTNNDTHNFDQIIDLSKSRLTNEDVVNSNPPTPIIAFEENMNKKQDSTSTNVPDLLL